MLEYFPGIVGLDGGGATRIAVKSFVKSQVPSRCSAPRFSPENGGLFRLRATVLASREINRIVRHRPE
jgi:hypothetical protein